MSNNTPAEVLILSAVKSVGKREFLKTFDRLFGNKNFNLRATKCKKEVVDVEKQCEARVKGERTGIKAGRFVLFEAARCQRHHSAGGLCPIHNNQNTKFGALPLGRSQDPLTDGQKKVFGEL